MEKGAEQPFDEAGPESTERGEASPGLWLAGLSTPGDCLGRREAEPGSRLLKRPLTHEKVEETPASMRLLESMRGVALGVGQTFAKVFSKVAVVWRKPESCRKLRVGRRDGDHFSECGTQGGHNFAGK